ncbi:MAG: acyl-CoA thioesterase [Eubacteriales bacterium]
MNNKVKEVHESELEIARIVRPTHLNASGRLFGGILLQWIDEAAGIVAKRHCNSDVITVAIDNLKFLKGAYQKDLVVLVGKLTWVGETSMEIRVDTFTENMLGERKLINTAYMVMVALDENDVPTAVPRLRVRTEAEKQEWEDGNKRRTIRILRKEEGF